MRQSKMHCSQIWLNDPWRRRIELASLCRRTMQIEAGVVKSVVVRAEVNPCHM